MVTDMIAKCELDMTEAVVNQRSSEEDADYRTAYQMRSHSRGQRRAQVTTRQPRGRSTTQADCRWHGRGQGFESP
jgi:hypothetical protein